MYDARALMERIRQILNKKKLHTYLKSIKKKTTNHKSVSQSIHFKCQTKENKEKTYIKLICIH